MQADYAVIRTMLLAFEGGVIPQNFLASASVVPRW